METVFILQELVEYMGMVKLLNRIRDATLQEAFDGLFPRDDPVNTRFSINYFTAIGNIFKYSENCLMQSLVMLPH